MIAEETKKAVPRCKLCNRPLKSKKSQEVGMGTTCLRRYRSRIKNKRLIKESDSNV